jgi:hypothetical protein
MVCLLAAEPGQPSLTLPCGHHFHEEVPLPTPTPFRSPALQTACCTAGPLPTLQGIGHWRPLQTSATESYRLVLQAGATGWCYRLVLQAGATGWCYKLVRPVR